MQFINISLILFWVFCVLFILRYPKKETIFYCLLSFLYFSQIIMYEPGSNVSPYAYSHGMLTHVRFFGLTFSAISCIMIVIFCSMGLLKKSIKLCKRDVLIFLLIIVFILIGILRTFQNHQNNFVDGIETGIRYFLPFLIYIFIKVNKSSFKIEHLYRFLISLNSFLVLQVLLSFIMYGTFSVNTYYLQMSEEYFGFFNSPHGFTCLLGMLSIFNFYCILEKKHTLHNILLFICNFCLIYFSGVRTYLLCLGISIAVIIILITKSKRYSGNLRVIFIILLPFLIMLAIYFIINYSSSNSRINQDLSSGRFIRWITDLGYYINQKNIIALLFGSGFDSIYRINGNLIGVEINSLNFIIDLLIDNGIVGTILYLSTLVLFIGKDLKKENPFYFALLIYVFIGCCINNILTYVTVMPLFILLYYYFINSQTIVKKSKNII